MLQRPVRSLKKPFPNEAKRLVLVARELAVGVGAELAERGVVEALRYCGLPRRCSDRPLLPVVLCSDT